MTVLASGTRIADRYQLDRRIAVGGMGEVWEAEDIRLGRSVAVKVLRPELSGDPEFLHRFRVEARTVASLDHSGIAAVFDYGEDDGPHGGAHTAYLVMELVRGEPLSSLIARGPLEAEQTLRIMEQSARALQAAHERGFVLVPWAQIDPSATARVGDHVRRVAELAAEVDTSGVRTGPDWSPEW